MINGHKYRKFIAAVVMCSILLTACSTTAQKDQGNTAGNTKGTQNNGKEGDKTVKNFTFEGSISREVLNNYLSRAVTHYGIGDASDGISPILEEDMRMLTDIGAKFIGRSAFVWGEADDAKHFALCKERADAVHKIDPEIILQACVFEAIYKQHVNSTPVPAWVFEAFGLAPEERNFNYKKMLYPDGTFVNNWATDASIQDITQLEAQMWIYYRACSYIDAGYEAIHFGQVHAIGAKDKGFKMWKKVLDMVRAYAKQHARRKMVLCDAHTHGIEVDGQLLFDFHAFPLRMKEVVEKPQQIVLEENYVDSIYGKSLGGVTPSGWKTDSLPFLVEFDNFGISKQPGVASAADDHWAWGYDEITWFAHQPEAYRNEVLEYVWKWVKERYPEGWVQFPTRRILGEYVDINYKPKVGQFDDTLFTTLQSYSEFVGSLGSEGVSFDMKARIYRANTQGKAAPNGFSQEETIKKIWSK